MKLHDFGIIFFILLGIALCLGCTSVAWAEPFLDLGVGATFFIPKEQDGTWYQEAFPYHFRTRDVAARAGIGWQFNERWKVTVSYLRLGSNSVTSRYVADENYDPGTHTCKRDCENARALTTSDSMQGGEVSVTRTFQIAPISPFLRVGGALMFHSLWWNPSDYDGHEIGRQYLYGRIPMVLVGGGVCYHWVCVEATYYHGIGHGDESWPISTRAFVQMVSLNVPLW